MKMWRKLFVTAALAFMLCLAGLVMSGEAQAQRLIDNGNGTVTDTQTGLMWTRDANLFGKRNWNDAMDTCSAFSISGIGGWRLPSSDELTYLSYAMAKGRPFTGIQFSFYWSSSTYRAFNADHAWYVYSINGYANFGSKTDTHYVWCTRTSQ